MSLIRITVLAAAGSCLLLAGCVNPQKPLLADHGYALNADLAAQVAEPEPAYAGKVEPASNGARAALASERYVKGRVTQPSIQTTLSVGAGRGGGGGGASAGAAPGR